MFRRWLTIRWNEHRFWVNILNGIWTWIDLFRFQFSWAKPWECTEQETRLLPTAALKVDVSVAARTRCIPQCAHREAMDEAAGFMGGRLGQGLIRWKVCLDLAGRTNITCHTHSMHCMELKKISDIMVKYFGARRQWPVVCHAMEHKIRPARSFEM